MRKALKAKVRTMVPKLRRHASEQDSDEQLTDSSSNSHDHDENMEQNKTWKPDQQEHTTTKKTTKRMSSSVLARLEERERMFEVDFRDPKTEPMKFWTSKPALFIFGVTAIAVVTRRYEILHVISFLFLIFLGDILLKWIDAASGDLLLRKCWKETMAWKTYAAEEVSNTKSSKNPFRRELEGIAIRSNKIVAEQTLQFVKNRAKKTKVKMKEAQKKEMELFSKVLDTVKV